MKYCVDCEYYQPMRGQDACLLPVDGAKPNIVTGRTRTYDSSCITMRSKGIFGLFKGRCGPEGKYFKAKGPGR